MPEPSVETATDMRETEAQLVVDRRFEAVVFDWDGTAVPDREADARPVRELIEELCSLGMDVAVVSGTHVENVDGQLRARPRGPGLLHLCVNRGSEVYVVDEDVRCVYRRSASAEEEAMLDAAADLTVRLLIGRGLETRIVSSRLNRRKIDLIPDPDWDDPPKARIAELLTAVEDRLAGGGIDGLREVVEVAMAAAAEVGLPDPKVTSDAKHVEIGLTDKADAARWVFSDLVRRGIGAGLVLVAGDEFGPLGGIPGSDSLMLVPRARGCATVSVGVEPNGVPPGVLHVGGGPDAFLELLEDQARRRRSAETPGIDENPDWVIAHVGIDPQRERVAEALLTIADGRLGTSGSSIVAHPSATAEVLIAGVYDGDGAEERLLPGPTWTELPVRLDPGAHVRRVLDLRAGLLLHDVSSGAGEVRALAFSSLARPGTVALRATVPAGAAGARRPEASTLPDGAPWVRGADGSARALVGGAVGGMAVALGDVHRPDGATTHVERLGAYVGDGRRPPAVDDALAALADAGAAGYEVLLREHRAAWADRWRDADIVIDGAPELQRAVRFSLFHLMGSVAVRDEAAVGARGLTGEGYRGHVFWDADVFTLPFLAATCPAAARAMLEYRVRRLPAARAAAAAEGRAGARFPWESARSGADVSPSGMTDLAGAFREVRTGDLEAHIVADVAWAAASYLDWTGDEAFRETGGRALLVETARYWASRIRLDGRGRGHIDGVIGPDEYHEDVDDDAFTNVMARWNLRRAIEAVGERRGDPDDVAPEEVEAWASLAAALVDGYDARTRIYEQFDGFFDLEPLLIRDLRARPVAADLVMGVEWVRRTQVVKQAAVLMLHHLVPDEVAEGSLIANLDYYEPRTAHGSSLSPGIHAAVLARAGRLDEALDALRLAARVDLDDVTGTTAAGLHLATMGSLWQALAMGFAGLRVVDGSLRVDPRLPEAWTGLEVPVQVRGVRTRVVVDRDGFVVEADGPLDVIVGRGRRRVDERAPLRVGGADGRWEVRDR